MNKIQIDVNADVVSRLSFEPVEEYDGLNLCYLTAVTYSESKSDETAKWEYKGIDNVPRLSFEFEQQLDAYNTKKRFNVKSYMPVSKLFSDGSDREDSNIIGDYIAMWNSIKHIHDAFAGNANYKAADFEVNFDHEGDINTRLAEFSTFFKAIEKWFNEGKDGNPIYKPFGGKEGINRLVLKLIASGTKSNYLEVPKYVGKGFVEKAVISNGKIDTGIKFTTNETYILGNSNITSSASNNPIQSEIGQDIKDILARANK
jgi:hypothetical protein